MDFCSTTSAFATEFLKHLVHSTSYQYDSYCGEDDLCPPRNARPHDANKVQGDQGQNWKNQDEKDHPEYPFNNITHTSSSLSAGHSYYSTFDNYFNTCHTVAMDTSTWLRRATKELKDIGIQSARLDAELILAHTLRKARTYLHAHLDEILDGRKMDIADARIALRKERVPLAYIVGHKEFYGRLFKVTPATLIPRPETEDLLELFLEHTANEITPKTLIDVGTGSGCLGISAKLERPNLTVTLLDVSAKALTVAERNAQLLAADVHIQRSDLLAQFPAAVNYILANLPYVAREWMADFASPELKSEPDEALYAADGGLKIIRALLPQASRQLKPEGTLYLEADPEQHDALLHEASMVGLTHIATKGYCIALQQPAVII